MQIYAAQGVRRFLLLTGYKSELIEEFVRATEWPEDVDVQCRDTGAETPTGGRLAAVAGELSGGPFCATYADGVADIDLGSLFAFHRAHARPATMTVVRPELQFGVAEIDEHARVSGFVEKPRSEHWVNGGFFCFEPEVLERLGPASVLERDLLSGLARDRQLGAYRHDGFWDCMDTYKDAVLLGDLWESGSAPWKVWADA
jgi:glucose-1-phosphate cytidylyltransferase